MSNLDDLYREIILDHYRSPRNRGELTSPPAHRVEGFNPLCGDEITIDLLVEGDAVTNLKLSGHGCSISQASSSLMSVAVKGRPLDDVRHAIAQFRAMMLRHESVLTEEESTSQIERLRELGEIAALAGVVKFPVRIKCATLAWNTLSQGLDELA